jgi:excisionase family DNA binding protein
MSLLTVKQASKILGVHENSIRNFDRRGILRSYRDHRRYRLFELEDVLKLKEKRDRLEFKDEPFSGSTLLTQASGAER